MGYGGTRLRPCAVRENHSRATHLDKVGRVAVVVYAARIEPCSSAIGAQTGDQRYCGHGRRAIGRWRG